MWLVGAGGLGVVVAYAFVALSFLVLRMRELGIERPDVVKHWRFTGYVALSLAFVTPYLPFSRAVIVWPYEWAIVIGRCLLGAFLLIIRQK